MKPNLESIFRCNDQSALIHNFVAGEDPPPEPWLHYSRPQSPLGKVSFPLVLTIVQGQVCTPAPRGTLIERSLSSHQWLPWEYTGTNGHISVRRTVTRDLWMARVSVRRRERALLLLEARHGRQRQAGVPSYRRRTVIPLGGPVLHRTPVFSTAGGGFDSAISPGRTSLPVMSHRRKTRSY